MGDNLRYAACKEQRIQVRYNSVRGKTKELYKLYKASIERVKLFGRCFLFYPIDKIIYKTSYFVLSRAPPVRILKFLIFTKFKTGGYKIEENILHIGW